MRIRAGNTRGRNRSKNIIKFCKNCGKEINGKIAHAQYCNSSCRYHWRVKNEKGYKERGIRDLKNTRVRLINLILEHYNPVCNCCGEMNKLFLTIDHTNNNGQTDRTKNGKRRAGGVTLYYKIINKGFPTDYQILCYNCNLGKSRNKGICPHKEF